MSQIGRRSGRPERWKHCTAHLWLTGSLAVCYRPRRARAHMGNVGSLKPRFTLPASKWSSVKNSQPKRNILECQSVS